jgi:hypothetical protein
VYKKFSLGFITTIITLSILVGTTNYIIDPYAKNNSFKNPINLKKAVRDERISKFKLLKEQPEAKSFLFGSSRGLLLDPVLFKKLTGSPTLNLAFSSASADEHYYYINYLLDTRKVEHIMIGIDLFAYAEGFISHGTLPQELRDYFNLDSDYALSNYISFNMLKKSIKTIKVNLKDHIKQKDKYTPKGQIATSGYRMAQSNPQRLKEYLDSNVINKPARWDTRFNTLDKIRLSQLEEISRRCKEQNVQLHLFTSPLYIKQIRMKQNKFFLQKKLLSYIAKNISPIWSYNAITKINTDPYAFDDEFHYTFKTADSIMTEVLTGAPTIQAYQGTYVTAENVDTYLSNID